MSDSGAAMTPEPAMEFLRESLTDALASIDKLRAELSTSSAALREARAQRDYWINNAESLAKQSEVAEADLASCRSALAAAEEALKVELPAEPRWFRSDPPSVRRSVEANYGIECVAFVAKLRARGASGVSVSPSDTGASNG